MRQPDELPSKVYVHREPSPSFDIIVDEGENDQFGKSYTITTKEGIAGWDTDGGVERYGLTLELAEFYATAINTYIKDLSDRYIIEHSNKEIEYFNSLGIQGYRLAKFSKEASHWTPDKDSLASEILVVTVGKIYGLYEDRSDRELTIFDDDGTNCSVNVRGGILLVWEGLK